MLMHTTFVVLTFMQQVYRYQNWHTVGTASACHVAMPYSTEACLCMHATSGKEGAVVRQP